MRGKGLRFQCDWHTVYNQWVLSGKHHINTGQGLPLLSKQPQILMITSHDFCRFVSCTFLLRICSPTSHKGQQQYSGFGIQTNRWVFYQRALKCAKKTFHTITRPPVWIADARQVGSLGSCCWSQILMTVFFQPSTVQVNLCPSSAFSDWVQPDVDVLFVSSILSFFFTSSFKQKGLKRLFFYQLYFF